MTLLSRITRNPIIGFGIAGTLVAGSVMFSVVMANAKVTALDEAFSTTSVTVSPSPTVETSLIPGPSGKPGKPGKQGKQGKPGIRGVPGKPGINGTDGADSIVPGPTGKQGQRGLRGFTGKPGRSGKPGKNSTVPGPRGLRGPRGPAGLQCPPGFTARAVNVHQDIPQGTIILFACVR